VDRFLVIPRQTKGSILHLSEIEIKIKFDRRPCKVLIAWDAIDLDIYPRHVFSRHIQTLTIRDDGRGARGTERISSSGKQGRVGHTCKLEHQRQLIRLSHLAVALQMIEIFSDDVTMIVRS
jgi:hypothetical protein